MPDVGPLDSRVYINTPLSPSSVSGLWPKVESYIIGFFDFQTWTPLDFLVL